MPLEILGPIVVLGISGIALALHLLGQSARLSFDDASARQAWLRHFPSASVRDVMIAPDGHSALIHSTQGYGVVWAMGADSSARFVAGAKARPSGDELMFLFNDLGTPRIRLSLPTQTQDKWLKTMGPL